MQLWRVGANDPAVQVNDSFGMRSRKFFGKRLGAQKNVLLLKGLSANARLRENRQGEKRIAQQQQRR